jgi:hypothetical protein
MAYFSYTGRNTAGELVQGVVEGADSGAVATQLFATGVTPVEIGETEHRQAGESIGVLQRLTQRPVSHEDLLLFSRQIHAGPACRYAPRGCRVQRQSTPELQHSRSTDSGRPLPALQRQQVFSRRRHGAWARPPACSKKSS